MKYPILALVSVGYAHGYEIKRALDEQFSEVWPAINVGQIYTTLSRLERDGLVESEQVSQSGRPNKKDYRLTDEGRQALENWVDDSSSSPRLKDEFFMKLILAGMAGISDQGAMIERQRGRYLQNIRDLDRMAANQGQSQDGVTRLLVEGATLHLEADLRWLDLCEQHFAGRNVE